ncbi:MAG: hypothetical protein SGPRY_009169, partial [Prymnesium sp.]
MLRHDLTYRLEQGWHAAFASPSNLCSSLPPGAFGALRLFFFLFWLSVTIWAVADDFDAQFWIYLTNWSLLFELTYFAFAAGLAMAAIFFNVPDAKGEKTPWYARVGYALQCSTYVISFIVSVLFWALVYDGGALPAISFFTHGSNFIVAFADLLLAGIPFRVGHMWVSLVFALAYVLFSLIYDVSGGMAGDDPYIYEVLDWNNNTGSAVGYSAGVVLIAFPV